MDNRRKQIRSRFQDNHKSKLNNEMLKHILFGYAVYINIMLLIVYSKLTSSTWRGFRVTNALQ